MTGYDGPLLATPRRAPRGGRPVRHGDAGRHRGRPRRGPALPAAAVGLTLAGMWLTVLTLDGGLAVFAAGVVAGFGWAARDITDRIEAGRADTWTRRG